MEKEINYKEEIKKCLKDMKSIKTFYKQIPNLLTLSRAIGGPIISIMFLMGHPIMAVVSAIMLFSTDMFDGKLARRWGVVSKFGADLDAFCDKIMFLGLSIPLLITNPIVILNFILEGVISLVNVVGRINGLNTKTVFSGKVKTCLLSIMLGIGYLVQYLNFSVSLLNIIAFLTSLSQGVAIVDYVKEYKRMNNEKNEVSDLALESVEDRLNVDTIREEKKLIDELKKEKEFLLDSVQLDSEIKPVTRKRTYGKKKR